MLSIVKEEELRIMQKRILIAEDDKRTRELLSAFAKKQGYEVSAVDNGVELLTKVTFESYDVVITDLLMADLNGASAAAIMKMQGNTTPIIAMTGVSPEDTILVKDNFTKVFHKPLDVKELFEYVNSLV
jgi:DNA-binding response OmpR family regulator